MSARGREIPPLGSSRWVWVGWWLDTILTYAFYVAIIYIVAHFVIKYW